MMGRAGCTFVALLMSATAALGQVSHVLPAVTSQVTPPGTPSVGGATVEAFPAQFVALQIQAALADPRNARHLDEAERLLGLSEITPAIPEPGVSPSLGSADPAAPPTVAARIASALKERLAESTRRVSLVAADLRGALPSAGLWVVSPWAPWVLVGGLVLLFIVGRVLSRPSDNRSVRIARKLARRGILPGEVARRTGLSQDVIRLLELRRKRREVA